MNGLAHDPAVPAAAAAPGLTVAIEVAPGELVDKITILEIKRARIADPVKLAHVERELAALGAARRAGVLPSPELDRLTGALRAVNERLWDIEDDIRRHEALGDFGAGFVELARLVYRTNDRRAELKRAVDALLGARFSEQKSYAAYRPATA